MTTFTLSEDTSNQLDNAHDLATTLCDLASQIEPDQLALNTKALSGTLCLLRDTLQQVVDSKEQL